MPDVCLHVRAGSLPGFWRRTFRTPEGWMVWLDEPLANPACRPFRWWAGWDWLDRQHGHQPHLPRHV